MKKNLLLALVVMLCCFTTLSASEFINLTPRPAMMTQGCGELTLKKGFKVGGKNLPADMKAEVKKFVESINATTSLGASAKNKGGLINIVVDPSVPEEGYKLSITKSGATIKASTATGLVYAFQTVKKLLPANVMAGVKGAPNASYRLPAVEITDQPRYAYRGFMLDVSRHFFDVNEVKGAP